MKRISVLLLALLMALACASALAETAADQGYTVKTGVSYDDPWGITVANVIYKDGQVFKILIDTVRPDGGLSSKEKFDDYGIKRVSSIGKDWWEQVTSFEAWVEGNDLTTLNLDDTGHDLDAVTGATINLTYYVEALNNAEAGVNEVNGYTVKTGTSYSTPWGLTIANVICKGDEVFKILVDTERPDGGVSSKEKYDSYGIKGVSSMGKEWWEQVVSFEDWARTNDVNTLVLDETGHDTDALTGATIAVSYYVDAVKDALSK